MSRPDFEIMHHTSILVSSAQGNGPKQGDLECGTHMGDSQNDLTVTCTQRCLVLLRDEFFDFLVIFQGRMTTASGTSELYIPSILRSPLLYDVPFDLA